MSHTFGGVMKSQRMTRSRLTLAFGWALALLLLPTVLQAQEKIAFTSYRDAGDGEIYVMDAGGSNQKRLTNNPAEDQSPAFSPDGGKIAFASLRDGNGEIYVMNTDGSNQKRLTNNPAGEGLPAWSPDGSKIVFVSNRDGNNEIYVMNADGSS